VSFSRAIFSLGLVVLPEGAILADFVRYELADGSEVFFESSEASLVSLRGGEPDISDAGRLGDRLRNIARAAAEVSEGLRQQLAPDAIELEFGVKMSGEVNWWFFSKTAGEGTLNVRLSWARGGSSSDVATDA
jgi:hypothetical protein